MRDHILSEIPYAARLIVGLIIYRKSVQTLHGQGVGRLSEEEIKLFRQEIWATFNDLLVSAKKGADQRDKPFWVLGGGYPTEADASLFGFIVSVLMCTA